MVSAPQEPSEGQVANLGFVGGRGSVGFLTIWELHVYN